MARCSLFGDDFISTFDESMYSFAGDCSYLLAGDCQKHSFSLIGKSWALNGGIGSGSQLSSALACGGLKGKEVSLQQRLLLKIPQRASWGMAFPSHRAPLGFSVGLFMGWRVFMLLQ